MICRKCGRMWFIEEISIPEELMCPSCGEIVSMEHSYRPKPPMDPDAITDIIIESCFHLVKSRGLPVLYNYSEGTLRYLTRIGYRVSWKEDHVIFMQAPEAEG